MKSLLCGVTLYCLHVCESTVHCYKAYTSVCYNIIYMELLPLAGIHYCIRCDCVAMSTS